TCSTKTFAYFGGLLGRRNRRQPFSAGPSFEEGALCPMKKMSRYLRQGTAGEVRLDCVTQVSDLPGRADSNVAIHLFLRRGRPSSKEGKKITTISTISQFYFARSFLPLTPLLHSLGATHA